MAGGILGGMLGGMLFRGLGFGGYGGGLFGIILILGIGYLLFRMVNRGREEPISSRGSYGMEGYQPSPAPPQQNYGQAFQPGNGDVATGLSHIRQMDAGFDENSFNDNVMDIFFNIQGAWMNRDLTAVSTLLTAEMYGLLQEDVKQLLREGRVNRLENIAVRSVEIVDAWQEQGEDFITARIYANLLDYTTDDTTGTVVAGSKTDPVKFEEFWTFTRPVGNNKWQLSAITQK
jgi:predicted lipid-binding transport protein (Tim44 family)